MTLSERQNAIVELIRREGYQAIEALAEHFGVTPQTIRRDVNLLCEARLLRRLHGGAELLSGAENLPYDTRRITHLEAKRRIAERVRSLIPNHASLFIGIGTTLEQVALALADHDDLQVVTNNLNAAMALSTNRSHRIIVAGGKLRLPDRDLLGEEVEALFSGYKVDYGVFGVGGIDEDGTLLDFDPAEVRAREALMANCRKRLLVADATKFGRNATVRGGCITAIDGFITDRPPPEPVAQRLQAAGVKLELAVTPEGEGVDVA
ncbi:MAG TPA: DeoR family transcriptional regulator [Kiloniellales bacterium]|nr:DeoR family transcriptional regulator [Kiloniellales bacterium]